MKRRWDRVTELFAVLITAQSFIPVNAIETASTNVGVLPDGEQALQIGDYRRAESIFTNALTSAPKGSAAEYYARLALAEAHLWQGEISDAAKQLKRADSLRASVGGNPTMLSRLMDCYAWLFQAQNDLPRALKASEEALTLRQGQGHDASFLTAMSTVHTAFLSDLSGQYKKSVDLYREALRLIPEGSSDLLVADIQQRLASVLWRLGQADEAQRLYQTGLQTEFRTNAPFLQYSPHPYWQNVMFRFQPGAPNTSKQTNSVGEQEIIWADGLTVAVTAPVKTTDSKAFRVDVAVKNDTNQPAQFLSSIPAFIVLAPKPSMAKLLDPQTLANALERKGERKAKWIRFWGENATQSVTTTVVNQPNYWGYGWNAIPPIVSYPGRPVPVVQRRSNVTTITQQVPDYAAQARAMQKAADAIENARASADDVRANSLGPTVVKPGGLTKGSLYFDAQTATKTLLRLPIGNAIFEFEFPPRQ